MATIHMVLQGKGGVGKSFVAATMAQYLHNSGHRPLCIDTEPINKTFPGYESLHVHSLDLMEGQEVDPRRFDELVKNVVTAGDEQHVVIDNGASSFISLADYLLSCEVPAMLAEQGHALHLHSVVTGGQGQLDTLQGRKRALDAAAASEIGATGALRQWDGERSSHKPTVPGLRRCQNVARSSSSLWAPSSSHAPSRHEGRSRLIRAGRRSHQ